MKMYTAHAAFADRVVLLAEDDGSTPSDVELMLNEAGTFVLLAHDAYQASLVASQHDLFAAILDIDLGQHTIERICADLDRRGVPYIFKTCAGQLVDRRWKRIPVLRKPVYAHLLAASLAILLAHNRGRHEKFTRARVLRR